MKENYLKNAEAFVDQVTDELQLFGLYDENLGWANCHAMIIKMQRLSIFFGQNRRWLKN